MAASASADRFTSRERPCDVAHGGAVERVEHERLAGAFDAEKHARLERDPEHVWHQRVARRKARRAHRLLEHHGGVGPWLEHFHHRQHGEPNSALPIHCDRSIGPLFRGGSLCLLSALLEFEDVEDSNFARSIRHCGVQLERADERRQPGVEVDALGKVVVAIGEVHTLLERELGFTAGRAASQSADGARVRLQHLSRRSFAVWRICERYVSGVPS